jgi:hypothetical protein
MREKGKAMGLQRLREEKLEQAGVTGFLAKGDVEESFRLVLENGVSPFSVSAIQMRGMLLLRKGMWSEAEASIATALSMREDMIGWKMRGDAHFLQNRYAEAEAAYRKTLELSPDSPEVLHDLGVAIVSQGRTRDCLQYFQRAIAKAPNRADFHHHFAIMLLLDGQEKAGWDEMQWRLNVPGVTGSFPYPERYWKGEDLAGKTIVIRSEQGWGDTILFMRYFPWLTARAAKVYFYGQRAILSLVKRYYPDVVVWPHDSPVPPDFDYHLNIMCLPRLIGDVPAPEAKKERGKGVGVCWFGSPTHKADHLRSVPIEMFGRFADAADEKLYSLGYGYFWKMNNGIAVGENKPDFLEYCITDKHDWLETAEFVQNLDLVITVDTAIAHLAGFLGVETWLLLPYVPDFRWGMTGERTKWYPSMKLYRQPKLFDWESVFTKAEQDLRARVGK